MIRLAGMVLAAISFSDPMMLAGVLAALIPVALHLLHRVRAPVVPFPTLRFLRITAQKTARRRQIQQYFLLLVRVLVFAMIAMAISSPLIRGGSASLAYGLVGMLLGAVALLVLAAVLTRGAIDRARMPAKYKPGSINETQRRSSKPYWTLSGVTFLLAIALLAFSAYGLFSDRYFSGDLGEFTGRSTALVIIVDNSHSMLAREGGGGEGPGGGGEGTTTRFARAKEQARRLLGETLRPAEATILPTNPGTAASPPPLTTDMTRLVGYLDKLEPQGRALPMQERIRTALAVLEHSRQPSKMLLILSDFARPAFADAQVFAGLKDFPARKDLQLILMPVDEGARGGPPADVGIVDFAIAQSSERPVIGAQVTFQATLVNNGDAADVREFALTVDGKKAEGAGGISRVQLGAAGTSGARSTVKIPYRLTEAGAHVFGFELQNAQDAMVWNDSRQLSLTAAEQIKVLVIGPEEGVRGNPRVNSAAFYVQAALAPFGPRAAATRPGTGGGTPWSIEPAYRGIGEIQDEGAFAGCAAVFVCDLPKISTPVADALAKYTQGGGRLVWILGPSIDAGTYNQVLLTQGRKLLPGTLGEPVMTTAAAAVDWVDLQSGLFANLFDNQEPFRTLLITGRWSMQGQPQGRPLATLGGPGLAGVSLPLFLEHVPGANAAGKVYTLLTTPAAAWSNLGSTVLLVPLASRMALGDAPEADRQQTNADTGQDVQIHVPAMDGVHTIEGLKGLTLDVTTPEGAVVNAQARMTGGANSQGMTPRWFFDQTAMAGTYRWRSSDGHQSGVFVVNPPGEEAELLPADVEGLGKEADADRSAGGARETLIVAGPADLLTQLERRSEGTSLLPGFVAMVLVLTIAESLMSNRYRPPAADGIARGVARAV